MADLIENLEFDEYIDPQNYTDFEKMGNDIEKRIQNIANGLINTMDKPVSKHTEIQHDMYFDEMLKKQQLQEQEPEHKKQPEQLNVVSDEETRASLVTYLTTRADTDPAACNELAVVYYLENDIDLAIKHFEKASEMGSTAAQRNLAIAMEQNNSSDLERIFELYSKAAEQADAVALNNLGCCYLNGDGTEEDIKKAIVCFEKAATKGDVLAKLNLADCYAIGNGVRYNPKKAFKLYKEASVDDNITALKRVAECYLSGQGTPQSFKEALYYYSKAADLGDAEGIAMYNKLNEKLSPEKYDMQQQFESQKQQEQPEQEQAKSKQKSNSELSL